MNPTIMIFKLSLYIKMYKIKQTHVKNVQTYVKSTQNYVRNLQF
jgi:hypothetical protein